MARRRAAGKKAGLERGVCVLCGAEAQGTPAKKDAVISLARRMRAILGMAERHSIACENCLQLALEKRKRFERSLKSYRIYAIGFFLFVIAGSLAFNRLDPRILLPALFGALIIVLLPYGYYFPAFESSGEK